MKDNIGFILIYSAMMVTIIVLHGCSSSGAYETSTGKLTCVGFCELDVGNRSTSVKATLPDGTMIEETEKELGLTQDNVEKTKAKGVIHE